MKLDEKVMDYFKVIHESCNSIEFTYEKKNSIYIPLFTGSIYHSFSIHLLENQNLTESSFALARPMVENYLRAMWVKYFLSEEKISEGCEKQHFPNKLNFMLKEINRAIPENKLFRNFKTSIESILTNMNDFTHGGIQSIARQYGEDGNLINSFDQTERQELLKLALLVSSFSYEELAPFMSCARPYNEIYCFVMEQIEL